VREKDQTVSDQNIEQDIEYDNNSDELENDAIHEEYDDDDQPIKRIPPRKKKPIRKISATLMTAAELQKQQTKNKQTKK
jgi:hypothetical protein